MRILFCVFFAELLLIAILQEWSLPVKDMARLGSRATVYRDTSPYAPSAATVARAPHISASSADCTRCGVAPEQ